MTLKTRLQDLFKSFKVEIPEQAKKGYGFIDVLPKVEDWVLGGTSQARKVILSRERDYTRFLPTREYQSKAGYDTYSCVCFSGLNVIEMIFKAQYGQDINFSDRAIASLIPVKPWSGTTYYAFWDAVRDYGLVLETEYPWTTENTPNEYLVKPPQAVLDKGKLFNQSYEIEHEWVGTNGVNPEHIYEALQFAPVQASVNAEATWTGQRVVGNQNHSITIVKAVYKRSFTILDHYERETYEVPWNFYFGSAKLASVLKKKQIPLIQIWQDPKLYALFGTVACWIPNEKAWQYGVGLGIWSDITVYSKDTFNKRFTIGEDITFV